MIIPHHDKSRKRKKKNLSKKLSIINAYINFKLSKVSNSRFVLGPWETDVFSVKYFMKYDSIEKETELVLHNLAVDGKSAAMKIPIEFNE